MGKTEQRGQERFRNDSKVRFQYDSKVRFQYDSKERFQYDSKVRFQYDSKVVRFQDDSSTIPRYDSSTIPRNDSSAIPRNDSSAIPRNDSSAIPRNDSSAIPRNDSSTIPRNDSSTIPRYDSSTIPRNDSSTIPRYDSSTILRNDSSTIPRNDSSAIPRNDSSTIPRNDSSAIPRNDSSAIPRNDSSAIPRNDSSAIPRNDSSAIPRNDSRTIPVEEYYDSIVEHLDKYQSANRKKRTGCEIYSETRKESRGRITPQASTAEAKAGVHSYPETEQDEAGVRSVGKSVYIELVIGNSRHKAMLDTGSDVTLIPAGLADMSQVRGSSRKLRAANGTLINLLGEWKTTVRLENLHLSMEFLVSDQIDEILIGMDWMRAHRCQLLLDSMTLSLHGRRLQLIEEVTVNRCLRLELQREVDQRAEILTCNNLTVKEVVVLTGGMEQQRLPNQCNQCQKAFTRPAGLRQHREAVHLDVTWPCQLCGDGQSSKSNLTRHYKRRHPERAQRSRTTPRVSGDRKDACHQNSIRRSGERGGGRSRTSPRPTNFYRIGYPCKPKLLAASHPYGDVEYERRHGRTDRYGTEEWQRRNGRGEGDVGGGRWKSKCSYAVPTVERDQWQQESKEAEPQVEIVDRTLGGTSGEVAAGG